MPNQRGSFWKVSETEAISADDNGVLFHLSRKARPVGYLPRQHYPMSRFANQGLRFCPDGPKLADRRLFAGKQT